MPREDHSDVGERDRSSRHTVDRDGAQKKYQSSRKYSRSQSADQPNDSSSPRRRHRHDNHHRRDRSRSPRTNRHEDVRESKRSPLASVPASPPPQQRRRRSRSSQDRERRRKNDSPRRNRSRSTSPERTRDRISDAAPPTIPHIRSRAALPSQESSFRGTTGDEVDVAPPKQKTNLGRTGLLAAESNTASVLSTKGEKIVLKYHEPPESRKPPTTQQWRLYVFDPSQAAAAPDAVHLYTQSCWLLGREGAVADVHCSHATISGQHAVIQFRFRASSTAPATSGKGKVKPYIIDLDSKAGTFLNGERIEASRYVEVRDGDLIMLGKDKKEYVFVLPPAEVGN